MLPNYVDLQPSLCKCCSPVCCRLFDKGGPKEPGPLLWLEEGGTKFSKELLKTLRLQHSQGQFNHCFDETTREADTGPRNGMLSIGPSKFPYQVLGRQGSNNSEHGSGIPCPPPFLGRQGSNNSEQGPGIPCQPFLLSRQGSSNSEQGPGIPCQPFLGRQGSNNSDHGAGIPMQPFLLSRQGSTSNDSEHGTGRIDVYCVPTWSVEA